jgi:hypothetical protein
LYLLAMYSCDHQLAADDADEFRDVRVRRHFVFPDRPNAGRDILRRWLCGRYAS